MYDSRKSRVPSLCVQGRLARPFLTKDEARRMAVNFAKLPELPHPVELNPRGLQHVLDDRVGALAVLHDLVEIVLQCIGDLADLCA
jgi:hypothetical protein